MSETNPATSAPTDTVLSSQQHAKQTIDTRLWGKRVRNLTPYVPGEQPKHENLCKLNTNENPFPPSPKVADAIAAVLANQADLLKRYPAPESDDLRAAMAQVYGVNPEQVFVGNGSDEVLAHIFACFFVKDRPLLTPDIGYSFYPVYADTFGVELINIALQQDFTIDVNDFRRPCGGIIIANPNAPTGVLLALDDIEKLLTEHPNAVIVIDEAYIDFGGDTAKELTRKYDNVLVVQTYSKSRSLAGLRIGYAIGNKELIKAMNDVKYSYNSYTMNEPSIVLGTAVLEDEEYFQETRNKIIDTREWFQIEMRKIGFSFADSKANFIFATHESVPAKEIFEAAKKAKIYVRYFDQPRINNYLRITIGTREEMETLLDFLKEFTATK